MSRKVYLTITAEVILVVDEGVPIEEAVSSLQFATDDDRLDVQDTQITGWKLTDSK